MNFGLSKQKGLEVTQTQERGKVSGRGNIAVGAEMHTHRRGSGEPFEMLVRRMHISTTDPPEIGE